MTKSKTQKRPLDEITYVRIMLPHVAAEEAKKISLAERRGKEWKSLNKRLKKDLEERYRKNRYSNPGILYKDISYERSNSKHAFKKVKPVHNSQDTPSEPKYTSNFENDMLVDMVKGATMMQKEWMREARIRLLEKIRKDEVEVSVCLKSHDIEVYNKVPFIVDGVPFFADMYIPELNIIIDISNKFKRGIDDGRWIEERYRKIKKTGCFLVKFDVSKLKDKNFLHNLTYELIMSKKKQQENY